MSEVAVLAIVTAILDLVKGLENGPTQAQVEATIRQALITASAQEMAAEFPNG